MVDSYGCKIGSDRARLNAVLSDEAKPAARLLAEAQVPPAKARWLHELCERSLAIKTHEGSKRARRPVRDSDPADIDRLFSEIPSFLEPYPPGVQPLLKRGVEALFFPGGRGTGQKCLDIGESRFVPVQGIMVLGHDFGAETSRKRR